MKKALSVLLIVAMLSVTACGSKKAEEPVSAPTVEKIDISEMSPTSSTGNNNEAIVEETTGENAEESAEAVDSEEDVQVLLEKVYTSSESALQTEVNVHYTIDKKSPREKHLSVLYQIPYDETYENPFYEECVYNFMIGATSQLLEKDIDDIVLFSLVGSTDIAQLFITINNSKISMIYGTNRNGESSMLTAPDWFTELSNVNRYDFVDNEEFRNQFGFTLSTITDLDRTIK